VADIVSSATVNQDYPMAPQPLLAGGDGLGLANFDEWLESACLGGALPLDVSEDLQRAAAAYHLDAAAEDYLAQAFSRAPEHPAVHIALYRFYFYKNRLSEALAVAQRCLAKTAVDLGLPADWREVSAHHAAFSNYVASYAAAPRFYLFTLKGCAYLNMRLGDLEQGEALLAKLIELDPTDKLGGSVLRGVLDRVERNDDE